VTVLHSRRSKTSIELVEGRNIAATSDLAAASPNITLEASSGLIRIHTLGRFGIQVDGSVLQFAGKSQRKPQELLKALIAFGSRDVPTERLIDCLWPDAAGDSAADALKTTLYRLRKLLQHHTALRLNDRHLSLATEYVWVDSLAFEDIAHQLKSLDIEALMRALQIYRGPFLDGESEAWVLSYRERLRTEYLAAVERLGTLLENTGDWPAATEIYINAVEIEPVAETLYRRLINSYLQLGRRTEALTAYQRCKLALQVYLGIKPARETQALYQAILDI
jgi:DNA-binding SARP family transcriptional activator